MKYAFTLCFALMATFTAPAQESTGFNLDFENTTAHAQPEGWTIANNASPKQTPESYKSTHHLDSTTVQNGKYSYVIDLTDGQKEWSGSVRGIKKTYNEKGYLVLSCYMKTEDVEGTASAWVCTYDKHGNVLQYRNMYADALTGTNDWKQCYVPVMYDKNTVKDITFGVYIQGKGKVWMDNFGIWINNKHITELEEYVPPVYPADLDTAYNKGSGISSITITEQNKQWLVNLGMLWGFIKYYHPHVRSGMYNMDAELFRVLPKVAAAKNDIAANKILEQWTEHFGTPEYCAKCTDTVHNDRIKLEPDFGYLFDKGNLPATLTAKLEMIRDHAERTEEQYYASYSNNVTRNTSFDHEIRYKDHDYPDAGVRLLTLYRYWNMIQYYFPDRHLTGTDWNEALATYMDDFVSAKNRDEYALACLKMIVAVDDSHATIGGRAGEVINEIRGQLLPPFACKFIEDQLVITDLFNDLYPGEVSGLKRGDIIVKIDGKDVQRLLEEYLPLTHGSNMPVKLKNIVTPSSGWLIKSNDENMMLTVKRGDVIKNVRTKRVTPDNSINLRYYTGNKIKEQYKLLDKQTGYIKAQGLGNEDLEAAMTIMKDTQGIIIDMRGYPSTDFAYTEINRFKQAETPFAITTEPDMCMPGRFLYADPIKSGGQKKDVYKGKLVVIVNELTQSKAEFATMSLSTVPGAVILGSTTSGADGDISRLNLPGGVKSSFSGLGILYPDGTESQMVGVKIDRVVKPTIQGIKEGRDELLEEAISIIKKS
mgnify:CR=1 FL=1